MRALAGVISFELVRRLSAHPAARHKRMVAKDFMVVGERKVALGCYFDGLMLIQVVESSAAKAKLYIHTQTRTHIYVCRPRATDTVVTVRKEHDASSGPSVS